MDGTLKPSVLNGQRFDVEFKMPAMPAVNSWTVSNWDNGRAGKLKLYIKVSTSERFTMFLKPFI